MINLCFEIHYLFFPRCPKPGKPLSPFLANAPYIPGAKLPSDAISVGLTLLRKLKVNYIMNHETCLKLYLGYTSTDLE